MGVVDLAVLEIGEAGSKAAAAEEGARSAKCDAAKAASSKYDLAGVLAGNVPLAVAGIVLIALGGLIMGYPETSAAASTVNGR